MNRSSSSSNTTRNRSSSSSSASTRSSGLLSNVFNFVSREIESFVANAAGRPTENLPPVSTSRPPSQTSPRRDRDHSKRRARTPPPPTPPRKHAAVHPNRATPRTRKPSVTMPGSLFSRSISPDPHRFLDSLDDDARRVHFSPPPVPAPSKSRHPRKQPNIGRGPESSFNSDSGSGSDSESPPSLRPTSARSVGGSSRTELRPRTIPSVKAVVQRFCVDQDAVDPSLLLPISPSRTKTATQTTSHSAGGHQRQSLGESTRGVVDAEVLNFDTGLPPRPDKGKQRERQVSSGPSRSPQQRRSVSETTVRGKERELLAAREERDRNERRWRETPAVEIDADRQRDKERIRALEREIAVLKEELAKKSVGSGRETSSLPHPPPPPPPPAPPPPVFISSATDVDTETLFGSARASLRHTALPVEAPINPMVSSGRTRRQGQPTVNVPSDKMAAFLNEIKTARLRKVGSVQGLSRSSSDVGRASTGGSSSLPRRASAGGVVLASARPLNRTSQLLERIGEKRKRSNHGEQSGREIPVTKRRSPVPMTSVNAPFNLLLPRERHTPGSTPLSQSYPSSTSSVNGSSRTWPPISITTETDITTPSLCSDNDVERTDDAHPATPPDIERMGERPMKSSPPSREVIDIDMDDSAGAHTVTGPQRQPPSSTSSPSLLTVPSMTELLLAKRPPTSPMPHPSPRKPRPPARAARKLSPVRFVNRDPCEEGDSPKAHTPITVAGPSKATKNANVAGRSRTHTGSSRHQEGSDYRSTRSASGESPSSSKTLSHPSQGRRRRPTLDEELRDAGEDLEDLDSGVLVGVGTKDKREGFLAHGGAGGIPVFMGAGYVQGVDGSGDEKHDEGENDADDQLPRRRRRILTRRRRCPSDDSS